MSYSTRIYKTIEEIGEANWQKICLNSGLYYSYYWLRSVQGQLTPDTFYITVWDDTDQQLVAGMPCYLVDNPRTYTFYNLPRLLTDEAINKELSPFLSEKEREELQQLMAALRLQQNRLYPTLIATAPYGYTSTICHCQDLSNWAIQQIVDLILDAFEQIKTDNNVISSAFLYVPQQHNLLPTRLVDLHYIPSVIGAESILPITWSSFEDYLLSYKQKRRKGIRRERRVFQESGFTVQIGDATKLDDTVALLQSNLQKKYQHSGNLERLKRGFEQIKTYLGPFVRVYLAKRNEQVLGYALFYEMDKTYYCKQVGFDYEQLDNDFCYFNIGFYEPIIQAIRNGITSINYGAGAYEAKLKRGCKLNYLLGFFKYGPKADDLKMKIADILELQDAGRVKQFDSIG